VNGVSVVLSNARIGLWSDPSTQLAIPHLTGYPITVAYDGTSVRFAGDKYPTGFRGEGTAKSYAMTARYMQSERADLLALMGLFDLAHASADSRLLLRTHAGQVAGLDTAEAIQVFGHQPSPGLGLYWDLTFTAVVVQHSFAV
jgi:hypothetical protein